MRDRDWELTQRAYGMDDEGWDRTLVRQRLVGLAGRLGVPLLDLTPALRAAERGILGGPYYAYDPHWNALGHQVVAAELVRFLREEGWLPACAARGERGDLLRQPARVADVE